MNGGFAETKVYRVGDRFWLLPALLAGPRHFRTSGSPFSMRGAFGHAKTREKLLGGVTCGLLALMRLPILMSH